MSTPEYRSNGSISGYEVESFGTANTVEDMDRWVREAQRAANDLDIPLVVVDTTDRDVRWTGALARRLRRGFALEAMAWKPEVFGRSKLTASRFAEKHLSAPPLLAEDVAQAYCLRVWAERSPEVLQKLKELSKRKAA